MCTHCIIPHCGDFLQAFQYQKERLTQLAVIVRVDYNLRQLYFDNNKHKPNVNTKSKVFITSCYLVQVM
jgi:hypothetical protein